MTYCCIRCEFDKARANQAPGRRNLRPMIPLSLRPETQRQGPPLPTKREGRLGIRPAGG